MFDYNALIQKEKREALRGYSEDRFRSRLNRKIAEETNAFPWYVLWFRKPALAGCVVLLVLVLGWLSTQRFLISSLGSEEMRIKNTLVQLLNRQETLLDQGFQPVDSGDDNSALYEFHWTVKRVLYAIQRENAQDVDISESLNRVLQNAAALINTENIKKGEKNI